MGLMEILNGGLQMQTVLIIILVFQALLFGLILILLWLFLKQRDRVNNLQILDDEVKRLQKEKWLFLEVNGAVKNLQDPVRQGQGQGVVEFKESSPISSPCETKDSAQLAEATTSAAPTPMTAKKYLSGAKPAGKSRK